MHRETPDFILLDLWHPNSPNLNPVDYQIWATMQDHVYYTDHGSLSAVTHAPFHVSMLRPASQAGPMHESAGVGKLLNAALLSLINEASVNVCCATLLSSELVGSACVRHDRVSSG